MGVARGGLQRVRPEKIIADLVTEMAISPQTMARHVYAAQESAHSCRFDALQAPTERHLARHVMPSVVGQAGRDRFQLGDNVVHGLSVAVHSPLERDGFSSPRPPGVAHVAQAMLVSCGILFALVC
jgi:hypothetical protein